MKAPNKNSIISKMIRYPFWFLGKTEANWAEFDLPKTSCGYGFMGILLGLLSTAVVFNVLSFIVTTLEVFYIVWVGEVFNIVTLPKDKIVYMFEGFTLLSGNPLSLIILGGAGIGLGGIIGFFSLPLIAIAAIDLILSKVIAPNSDNISNVLGKVLGWLVESKTTSMVINLIGKGLSPLKMAYKSLHKKLCVPMEYKDE